MPAINTWIPAAVSGATVDGRNISAESLEQCAASYNQGTYNARIHPEHLRGTVPGGMFKALGSVTDVKAESIQHGALAGKTQLSVKIDATPELIAMNQAGEKVHLSIEIQEDFADTGGAYLVGLGVTDSPASLGTGIMKFNTQQRTESLFSNPLPAVIAESSSNEGIPSAAQFAKVQGDIQELKQTFSRELDRLFSKLSDIETSVKETGITVEEIGNASTGRFQRRPATGDNNQSRVDY